MDVMVELKQLNKHIPDLQITNINISVFEHYRNLLQAWNNKINLTSITGDRDIQIKHFFDSLTCFYFLPCKDKFSLIDIGTGAGFPGIPLKIINPEIQLTLVDSVNKKADFCRLVVAELGLSDVQVLHARVEDLGKQISFRERYDWAVARAVADLSVLAEYLLPLIKTGGHSLVMKSINIHDEIERATSPISILGGKIGEIKSISLPDNYGDRILINLEKIKQTPRKYPRKAGLPVRNPLE